jgi:tRNA A-37 threonylcarbamoyl transferase component Bud32
MSNTALPATIGKYRVLRELGRGATSTVYLAEDPFNDRKVAVKRIHAHLLTDERQARRYRRSLRNEALLAGQLRHPHIVSVYDADGEADPPYIVLEYIEGAPLARFARADRLLPVEQVLDICYTCCSALDYASTHGLVHRDIKPANLMLQSNGDVKLTDFGTALMMKGDATLTMGLVGSPLYMSPEQVREQTLTHHSDMFSLAVVMYELLTARRPFEGDSDYATLFKISAEDATPPSVLRPGLPAQVDYVLLRAMQKKPEDRYEEWMDFGNAILGTKKALGNNRKHRDGERYAQMRLLPFFAAFSDAVLWEALRLGTLRSLPRGTALMNEGTPGDSFQVLLEGTATILRKGWKLTTVEPGVTIGEMAYLQRGNPVRTATAIAESDVVVLEIRNEALRMASDELQLCFDKAFIDLLVNRLIATNEKLGKEDDGGLVVGTR